jgi:hypothetical protein
VRCGTRHVLAQSQWVQVSPHSIDVPETFRLESAPSCRPPSQGEIAILGPYRGLLLMIHDHVIHGPVVFRVVPTHLDALDRTRCAAPHERVVRGTPLMSQAADFRDSEEWPWRSSCCARTSDRRKHESPENLADNRNSGTGLFWGARLVGAESAAAHYAFRLSRGRCSLTPPSGPGPDQRARHDERE